MANGGEVFTLESQFRLAGCLPPAATRSEKQGPAQKEERANRYALSRSITNISVSFGGILGGEPWAP